MNAWVNHGCGMALLRELYKQYNVVNFPCGATGTQMGGWFRHEVKSVEDLKGLQFRCSAFAGAVLSRLGVVPSRLPVRTEDRREGTECVSTCRSRLSQHNQK